MSVEPRSRQHPHQSTNNVKTSALGLPGKSVSLPINRQDVPRLCGVVLEFAPQVHDVRIDAPGVDRFFPPDFVEDTVTAHHLAPGFEEQRQNRKLLGRQLDGDPFTARLKVIEVNLASPESAARKRTRDSLPVPAQPALIRAISSRTLNGFTR